MISGSRGVLLSKSEGGEKNIKKKEKKERRKNKRVQEWAGVKWNAKINDLVV